MGSFTQKIGTPTDGFTLKVNYEYEQDILTNSTKITNITGQVKRNNSSYYPYNTSKIATMQIQKLNENNVFETVKTLSDTSGYNFNSDSYFTWIDNKGEEIVIPHKSNGEQTLKIIFTVDGKLSNYYPVGSVTREIPLETLHTPPAITNVAIEETSLSDIANDLFVLNLSKKQITITAEAYDNASIVKYIVENGSLRYESTTNVVEMDLSSNPAYISGDKIPLRIGVVDNLGGTTYLATIEYDCIKYIVPTFINTTSNATRSDSSIETVVLNLEGSFYNGTIGNTTNSLLVQYKIWEKGTEEPTNYTTISDVVITDNQFKVTNLSLGTNFSIEKAYSVLLKVSDSFSTPEPLNKSVPIAEHVWAEYKDRVDFKKITQQGKQVATVDNLVGTILYDDSSGSNENIDLQGSASNYEYFEIFFKGDGDNACSSVKVYEPNGKNVSLISHLINESGNYIGVYLRTTIVNISDDTINIIKSGQLSAGNYGIGTNYIYITKVVGYKKGLVVNK